MHWKCTSAVDYYDRLNENFCIAVERICTKSYCEKWHVRSHVKLLNPNKKFCFQNVQIYNFNDYIIERQFLRFENKTNASSKELVFTLHQRNRQKRLRTQFFPTVIALLFTSKRDFENQ